MVAHLANKARKQTLAEGATEAEAKAAAHIATTTVNVAGGNNTPMTE
jgi:hypothetical protein